MSDEMRFTYSHPGLNDIVGPVEPGVLMSYYGYSAVGKTTLAAYIPILETLKQNVVPKDGIFCIIDCDSGFSLARLGQILKANGVDPKSIEDKLWYFNPTSFAQQHDVTRKLNKEFEENGKVPLLIVNDAMTAIYRQIVLTAAPAHRAATMGTYTGKLNLQLNDMRKLAVKHKCPFIVTTWKSSPLGAALGADPEADLIGGRAFVFLPKVIVRLEAPRGIERPHRHAVLKKHREKPGGLFAKFQLADAGIE